MKPGTSVDIGPLCLGGWEVWKQNQHNTAPYIRILSVIYGAALFSTEAGKGGKRALFVLYSAALKTWHKHGTFLHFAYIRVSVHGMNIVKVLSVLSLWEKAAAQLRNSPNVL